MRGKKQNRKSHIHEMSQNLPAILVIIFWNFTMFQYRSKSPQVKQYLVSSMVNLVYELPNDLRVASRVSERLKTQGRRKLGNIGKISNFVGDVAQCTVSPREIKLCQQQSKNTQSRYQTFLFLSNFTGFFYSGQIFCPGLQTQLWIHLLP